MRLTKGLLSAYSVGVFPSRKIPRRLSEDIAFRVLAADNRPDVRTIAAVRQRHLTALDGLVVQVRRLAREAAASRCRLRQHRRHADRRFRRPAANLGFDLVDRATGEVVEGSV